MIAELLSFTITSAFAAGICGERTVLLKIGELAHCENGIPRPADFLL
jgi:hypothetical protein